MVVSVGFRAAFFRIIADKDQNKLTRDDYFLFLRKPYLNKTISVALAYLGISVVAAMLCFFPIIYVVVPLNLLTVIYAFNPELSVSELVKLSFNLGNKKWFITFGLIIVAGFLAQMVGMLMCGIGILFTASFALLPLYFIYIRVIGHDSDDVEKIGIKSNF